MTGWAFWVVAALMTAGAVALLLRRLFATSAPGAANSDAAIYRDQLKELERERAAGEIGAAEAEAAKAEIGRRLLAAAGQAQPVATAPSVPPRRIAFGLAVLLPVAALAIYLAEGTPNLPSQPFASRDPGEREAVQSAMAEARALEQRMAENPQDRAGWVELGRRWGQLGDSAKAADAFGRAIGLGDADPELIGRYGEALVGANAGTVTETAHAAFQQVLALRPNDIRARYFLALGNAQAGDDKAALALWQALMRESPADAPWVPSVRQHLAEAAQRLGLDPAGATPEPQPAARQAPPAGGAAGAIAALPPDEQEKAIRGMVDGLAARLAQSPDDLEGWVRLARARGVLGEADAAADAYAKAAALAPDNNDLLRAYADALLNAGRGEDVPPVLETGLRRILASNPNDLQALWFLGVAAQKAGQPEEARRLWGRMRDQFQEGSAERRAIEGRMSQLPAPGAG
ncbi:c-type cytochrome biogenesis protein CcmI [Inquilinus sp.]|uniref:c-type cytochrome biogenesis protein CcmI n=1 Tax=Inquilinus sp. TaxID=1932117 RepID=UPI0031E16C0A